MVSFQASEGRTGWIPNSACQCRVLFSALLCVILTVCMPCCLGGFSSDGQNGRVSLGSGNEFGNLLSAMLPHDLASWPTAVDAVLAARLSSWIFAADQWKP